MASRANLLLEGTCSVYPKVGEVLPIDGRHEEIHDDMSVPRRARANVIGKDKVLKREIGSEGHSRTVALQIACHHQPCPMRQRDSSVVWILLHIVQS